MFRSAFDPILFNLQKFQIKLYNWLSEKAKHDEFYDKFLKYFTPPKEYFFIIRDKLYFFHMNEELHVTNEVPLESVIKVMINYSTKAHVALIKPVFLAVTSK